MVERMGTHGLEYVHVLPRAGVGGAGRRCLLIATLLVRYPAFLSSIPVAADGDDLEVAATGTRAGEFANLLGIDRRLCREVEADRVADEREARVRRRDDCAFQPSMRHFLIKEAADGLKRRRPNFSWNEAAMSADNLLHKTALSHDDVSGTHDSGADSSDLRKQSAVDSVNIEQVAQLAKFYAAGTPPDEEFRSLKERINLVGDGAHAAPKEWRTSEEMRSSGLTHDPDTTGDAFNQRIEMGIEKSDFLLGYGHWNRRFASLLATGH